MDKLSIAETNTNHLKDELERNTKNFHSKLEEKSSELALLRKQYEQVLVKKILHHVHIAI